MTLSSKCPFISAIEKAYQTRDHEKLINMKNHFSMRRHDLHNARIEKGWPFSPHEKELLEELDGLVKTVKERIMDIM